MSIMQPLDALAAFYKNAHAFERLWLFSCWSGPHYIISACGKWWKHGVFSVMKETLNTTFLCSFVFYFWKDCCHVVILSVFFFFKALLLLFWRVIEWMSGGLFEEMKWLGQVCCSICVPETLLFSTTSVKSESSRTSSWAPHCRTLYFSILIFTEIKGTICKIFVLIKIPKKL